MPKRAKKAVATVSTGDMPSCLKCGTSDSVRKVNIDIYACARCNVTFKATP